MSNLYNNIIALCNEKGIKGAKLCNDIGISKGKLTDLKMGRRTGLNATTAQKIASYFGVSVGYLLGEEERTATPKQELIQDEVNTMNFAENLKFLRTQHNITQEQLAFAMQCKKSTISMYELGNREPDLQTLIRLSLYFNVSTDTLLGKDDKELLTSNNLAVTKKRQALLDFAASVPEDKVEMIMRVIQSIVES